MMYFIGSHDDHQMQRIESIIRKHLTDILVLFISGQRLN